MNDADRSAFLARGTLKNFFSRRICDEFEEAWSDALTTGHWPQLAKFLARGPAAEREALERALQQIEQVFQQRLSPSVPNHVEPTLEVNSIRGMPPSTPDGGAQVSTPGPEATLDPSATIDPAPGANPDVTFDMGLSDAPPVRRGRTTYTPKDAAGNDEATLDQPPSNASPMRTIDSIDSTGTTGLNSTDFSISDQDAPPVRKSAPRIAGHAILGVLGRGGMGVVYKARQIKLNRVVALKMVLDGVHAGSEQLARFQTEAEAVARLAHPNIVQIYEVGEHDGLPFFSLEYVDGGCLANLIGGKPQPPAEAARIVERLADAMESAHRQSIIHRDLKPANVLLTIEGEPKITDFGLAKRLEGDASQTRSGTLMGTPSYMAPEQARGDTRNIGPLSDLYALGAILYEMLTGRPPFQATTIVEVLDLVQKQEPVPPRRLQPKVPRDLETICLRCLQKEPEKRYASSGDLAADLLRFQAGEPILARPVGQIEKAWRWCKRNPRVATLSALVALLVLVLGTTVTIYIYQAQQESVAAAKREDSENKANDETRKLTLERLEQARAAISIGDHQRAGLLLRSSDPRLNSAEPLHDVRDQVALLKSQVDLYSDFKKLLDNARFAALAGSRQVKEQAQKNCRELVEMAEQIRSGTGRGAAGLPPLNAEQRQLFLEDIFESYLIAALLETDLAASADRSIQQEAARRSIDWLNRAEKVLPGMKVTYVRRAPCWGLLGNKAEDDADMARALATKPTSAIDRFWHGFADHLRAEEARRKGDKKAADGFYRHEIEQYAALLQVRSDHVWGYFNWASCQAELGNPHDAIVGYTACIRIRPDFPWPYHNRGTVHFRLGEYDQAMQDYTLALKYDPDYAEAYANRGLLNERMGQAGQALIDLNRAIALNPDYAQAYEYRGDYHLARKEFPEAVVDYRKTLELTQDKVGVYLKLADVHSAMGRPDAAVNDCNQAQALEPGNANVIWKRAGFLEAVKDFSAAVKDYSTLLDRFARHEGAREKRANLYWVGLKNFDAALADLEELAKLYPKNAKAHFRIGAINLGRRKYDAALAAFENAILAKPSYIDAHWGKAQIATWRGDLKQALEILNPVVATMTAETYESLNIRGDIFRAMNRLDEAAADYRCLIALKPELVETYVSLASVYQKQGKPDLAKECLESLVEANPKSMWAYIRRAEFRRAHGQFKEALADCALAAKQDPKSIVPELVETSILAAQGSGEAAVAKAEALLESDLAPIGDGHVLYAAACTWSLASRAAANLKDKKKAAELAKQYTDGAADLLADCLDIGFHDLIYPELNRMAEDPALDPVRRDPRVSRLVELRP